MSFFLHDMDAAPQFNPSLQASKLKLTMGKSASDADVLSSKVKEEEPRHVTATSSGSKSSHRLTAAATSELDPLSALNLARAADPWFGNSLVTSPASSHSQAPNGTAESPVSLTGAPSLAATVLDEPTEGEDWSDFITFAPSEEKQTDQPKAVLNNHLTAICLGPSDPSNDEGSDSYREEQSAGRQRHDNAGSDSNLRIVSPFQKAKVPPTAPDTCFSSQQTFLNAKRRESSGFGASLLARLASFTSSYDDTSASGIRRNYDSYDVTFEHGPVGIQLETDWYGRQAVVKGFQPVGASGEDGPAKRCGMIRVGDVLTAINGESCLTMGFSETLEALRRAGKSRHTLHFKSLDAAGDLSVYASDQELVEARAFIHEHKQRFYRPPVGADGTDPHVLVHGCVERLRGDFVTAFNFHHEDSGEFLLAASCASNGSGPFIFHTIRDSHLRTLGELPQSEDSAVYLGRLEPSFLGTEFTLLDHHSDAASQQHEHELAFFMYSANVLGRVPNSLKCVIPKPAEQKQDSDQEAGEPERVKPKASRSFWHQPSGMGSDGAVFNTHSSRLGRSASLSQRCKQQEQSRSLSLMERLRSFSLEDLELRFELATDGALSWLDDDDVEGHARAMRIQRARIAGHGSPAMDEMSYGAVEQDDDQNELLSFQTKKPSWNESLGAWTLNFQGRVKIASKKNFLLVPSNTDGHSNSGEDEAPVLRFGKVSKTRFSLDYAAPLAPIQALAIACSTFAHKIAVT